MMTLSISHHTAELGDVRLHYVTCGQGPAVVLLHGWPQTWWEWRRIMPALSQRYTVIAPDLRGLGDSSCPQTGYDKRTVANDIWRLVNGTLGHQRFFLVGHDWGGPTAYALAHAHPDAVEKLAIVDVVIPFGTPEALTWGGKRWHHGFHWVQDLPEALVTGRERTYLSWFYTNLAYNPAAITREDIDEYVRAYSQPGVLRAGFEYYRATPTDIAHNNELMKTKLRMPVLAVGGAGGKGRGLQVLENLKELATDVRGGAIPACGHWVPEEQPEELSKALMAFFGGAL